MVTLGAVGIILALLALAQPYRALLRYRSDGVDQFRRELLLCGLLLLTLGIVHNIFESTLLHGLNALWTIMLLSVWTVGYSVVSSRFRPESNPPQK